MLHSYIWTYRNAKLIQHLKINQSNSPYSNKGEKRWIISRNEKPFMYKFSANYIYKKKKEYHYTVYILLQLTLYTMVCDWVLSHKEKGKEENGHCHHFYSMTNKQKICHCSNACKKMHRDWGEKIKLFLFIDSSIMYLTNSKDFTKSFMN